MTRRRSGPRARRRTRDGQELGDGQPEAERQHDDAQDREVAVEVITCALGEGAGLRCRAAVGRQLLARPSQGGIDRSDVGGERPDVIARIRGRAACLAEIPGEPLRAGQERVDPLLELPYEVPRAPGGSRRRRSPGPAPRRRTSGRCRRPPRRGCSAPRRRSATRRAGCRQVAGAARAPHRPHRPRRRRRRGRRQRPRRWIARC